MIESVSGATIALVTAQGVAVDEANDERLRQALIEHGAAVRWCVWDDPDVDWAAFDIAMTRSCWDYHLRADEFRRWLDWLDRTGVRVVNPPDLLRWNMHKSYLLDLERAGIKIPPTHCVDSGRAGSAENALDDAIAAFGSDDLVIKPAVSANAYWTWRSRAVDRNTSLRRIDWLLARGGVLLQTYEPAVAEVGEWSLIHAGTELLHSVRKRPCSGDFRSQPTFGAAVEAVPASGSVATFAAQALDCLPACPAYARIDVVDTREGPRLMEIELIEPNLFLTAASARRLASHLLRRVCA